MTGRKREVGRGGKEKERRKKGGMEREQETLPFIALLSTSSQYLRLGKLKLSAGNLSAIAMWVAHGL